MYTWKPTAFSVRPWSNVATDANAYTKRTVGPNLFSLVETEREWKITRNDDKMNTTTNSENILI